MEENLLLLQRFLGVALLQQPLLFGLLFLLPVLQQVGLLRHGAAAAAVSTIFVVVVAQREPENLSLLQQLRLDFHLLRLGGVLVFLLQATAHALCERNDASATQLRNDYHKGSP